METTHKQAAFLLTAICMAAASPSVARAQFTTATSTSHQWLAIGLGGGSIVPTGNATTDYQGSFQGQAYIVINLGILPELRFNIGFERWNFKQQLLSNLGYPTASGYNNVLTGIGGTRIDLLRGPVRPYLTLGVGAFNFKSVVDTGATAGSGKAGTALSGTTTKFGLDGGAGIAVHIGRVEAFTEGRIQNVFTNTGFISSAKQIQAIPVTFGLMFAVL
jgi:hypothetical protein